MKKWNIPIENIPEEIKRDKIKPRNTAMFPTRQILPAYRGCKKVERKIKEIGTSQKRAVYRVWRNIGGRAVDRDLAVLYTDFIITTTDDSYISLSCVRNSELSIPSYNSNMLSPPEPAMVFEVIRHTAKSDCCLENGKRTSVILSLSYTCIRIQCKTS